MSRMNWKAARYSAAERQGFRAGHARSDWQEPATGPASFAETSDWRDMKAKYATTCTRCGGGVSVGESVRARKNGNRWELQHSFH